MSRTFIAIAGALAAAAVPASASGQPPAASFAQLSGQHGCLLSEGFDPSDLDDEDAPKDCATTRALLNPVRLVPAPGGGQIAVVSAGSDISGTNGVTVLTRDPETGALSFGACVTDDGGDGRVGSTGACDDGDALGGANALAFSPDGRFAYVSANRADGVAWFARDAAGRLTPSGCAKRLVGLGDHCLLGGGLDGAADVLVSRDGAKVYVAARVSSAVHVFDRNPRTGALTPRSCVSATGSDGTCTRVTGLNRITRLAMGPGGRDLYAASALTGALVTLGVDAATGDLSAVDCLVPDAPAGGPCRDAPLLADGVDDMVVSPDGTDVLVGTFTSDREEDEQGTVLVYRRDGAKLQQVQCLQNATPTGDDVTNSGEDDEEDSSAPSPTAGCDTAKALGSYDPVTGVAVSADGRGVFAVSDGSLAAFTRDPSTGKLTQFACAESDPSYKTCSSARALSGADAVAASADARNVYVASSAGAMAVFGAAVAISSRATVARADRIRVRLACPGARREGCAGRLSGARYGLRAGRATTVAVRLPARVRRTLRARRVAQMTLIAREPRQRVTRTITVRLPNKLLRTP